MTAFVAKMLTLFGVVVYAGGPIDAVTLIAQGEVPPHTQEVLLEHMVPASQASLTAAVVAETDLIVDSESQKDAVSFMEVGLRSGIGFEH